MILNVLLPNKFFKKTPKVFFAIAFLCFLAFPLAAQTKSSSKEIDHLTIEEDELVHSSQEIDKRVDIFIKAIDRRFQVLNLKPSALPNEKIDSKHSRKINKKDAEDWGALPTGNRAALLADIDHILNETVRNIDNAAERNSKNPLLVKSLANLADACSRFLDELKSLEAQNLTDAEQASAFNIIETAKQILETRKQQASLGK